jgi:hypothetical protein
MSIRTDDDPRMPRMGAAVDLLARKTLRMRGESALSSRMSLILAAHGAPCSPRYRPATGPLAGRTATGSAGSGLAFWWLPISGPARSDISHSRKSVCGWSWAVYGYAATAAATRVRGYLDLAEKLAERFLERLGSMAVPPYDLDDPDPKRPLDSAAAAILASALLDVAALHPDRSRAAPWRARALALLDGLVAECFAVENNHRGLLKHGCSSWPQRDGVDSAVSFGDFFFVEALCKLLLPGKLRPELAPLD